MFGLTVITNKYTYFRDIAQNFLLIWMNNLKYLETMALFHSFKTLVVEINLKN